MARDGNCEIAEAALAALVNDPHGGRTMIAERTLLDGMRARDRAAVDAALARIEAARRDQSAN